MTEKRYVSPRGKVSYWISRQDNGRLPLVLLHGLTADHTLFDKQAEAFRKERTVLAWDAPGHGRSTPYQDFSYGHLAEDLRGILRQEGISRAVLVGQSMGGFVAQSFLARYPAMGKGLFTIGTCPYGEAYYSQSDLFWLRQTKWMFSLFPDGLLRRAMAAMCGRTPKARENMLRMLTGRDKKELCTLMYLGFAGFIPEIQNLRISCPVCLTVGEYDWTGKVRRYNEQWHMREGYPLHIIPGAAHNANVDNPRVVNELIQRFLEELERKQDGGTA